MKLGKVIKHLNIEVPVTIVIETGEIVYNGNFESIPWRLLNWQLNTGANPAININGYCVYIYLLEEK